MISNFILKQAEQNNLFDCILDIGCLIKQTGGISDQFVELAKPKLQILSEKLEIDMPTTALFAALLNLYNGSNISLSQFANYLKIDSIVVFSLMDKLEELEQKDLIQICHYCVDPFFPGDTITFNLPYTTLDALRRGTLHELSTVKTLSIDGFFTELEQLFEKRTKRKASYQNTKRKIKFLLQNNLQLNFVQKILNLKLLDDDLAMLLHFFHCTVNNNENEMNFFHLSALYENNCDFTNIKRQLMNGSHVLIQKGLIENICSDGFHDTEAYSLSEEVKDDFLAELDIVSMPVKGLIESGSIAKKKLFYPLKTQKAIDELYKLLQPSYFTDVQKRLQNNSMRTGFACLFSGYPGTGKTETSYQLARMSGRDIMQIDISNTKSKWFGDSEKQIKAVFDKYRTCVKNRVITPILLINEADAIFGKRRLLNNEHSGSAQTENAIQNIILQEIENLNGILIATTNLSKNMDTAFERRFLYKIEFEKPEPVIRKEIWLSLIPTLSEEKALNLSARFDFSGGQIENIARKCTVHQVLSGNIPSLEEMIQFCDEETFYKENTRRIGFAA